MSKVIVITGAGVGLGRALARRFASEGETLVLLGRTASKVEALAKELGERASAFGCDVASPESVRAAFAAIAQKHPRIDVLINNAGVFEPFTIAEATDDQVLKIIGTNLCGAIFCARSAIASMGPGSHIINVSSESVKVPFPHLLVYQTSKAGLERFSEGLSAELEASGIRVSTVRAGQMFEHGKVWDADPQAQLRFAQASAQVGIHLRERPLSQFTSVTHIFRVLIDLPSDLHTSHVSLHARKSS